MPLSEKKRASNAKWDAANLKRLSLAIPIDLYNRLSERLQQTGETMNKFIRTAIENALSAGNSAGN